MAKKIVTLGEIMLRLSPKGYDRFLHAQNFDAFYGGGEANVAVALSNFGYDAYFVTKLPEHEIGQAAINSLRQFGVKTDYIKRGGDRVGIYYSENGVSLRPSKVIYDRKNSSFSKAKVEDFDFDEIFKNTDVFHVSGITPAISKNCQEITLEAMKKAKENNVFVSFDLNYRSKLWTLDEALEFYEKTNKYVDLCIGVIPQIHKSYKGEFNKESLEIMFKETYQRTGIKNICSTIRECFSASRNRLSAGIYSGDQAYFTKAIDIEIVERIGGGDSFTSGLLTGLLDGKNKKDALDFAVATSAIKHTIKGDVNLASRGEIENLVGGDTSGKVQR
ncbi:sugar kinase [Anaerococcus senegalensis]|uniref:sugar kinase n=1 Tax=Anaerococcus senegalensis TaxID=1288120 RepID=UPI00030B1943|nr:sugar kinase [Anaerococcus senegalensis]